MNRGTRPASTMFLYAAVMVGGGMAAYLLAPEGADAKTALVVPSACAAAMVLCSLLVLQIERNRFLGVTGARAGFVLPLVFAAVIGFRAVRTGAAVHDYQVTNDLYEVAVAAGSVEPDPEARRAYFEERGAPDHDKSYLRNVLWLLSAASAGAAVLVFRQRPR